MSFIKNTTINSFNNTLDSTSQLLQLSLWPLRIICPLLIVFCPIANWICIRVFQSRIYSRSSSKWYFISIAIFDTIYVVVTAPLIFLLTFEIYILNWNILFCKLIVFLNYLSCQISAGLLACLSIDRLVATSCLSLYRYSCSANISKYVCIFVILTLSLINSHYLIGYTIDSNGYCSIRYYKWYENSYSNLNIVYLLSYSIIPFTIISICNLFIVLNVCHKKSIMKTKYEKKRSMLSPNHLNEDSMVNLANGCFSNKREKRKKMMMINNNNNKHEVKFQRNPNETKRNLFVTVLDNQMISKSIDLNFEMQSERKNGLPEKLLLNGDERISIIQPSSIRNIPIDFYADREIPPYDSQLSSPSTYSQKLCVQLQITISLLAISISFIFCTLPNCISTIRIQTYNYDEQVRKFWQAMNYLSIVPLLITHSVNLFYYYLSSHMFRNHFKDIYLRKTKSMKQCTLKTLLKS
ncbi:unnamed protein product [Rotaria socialis]|uniref:G-protein coupled receptors family 1 profile domain-containing protein n=1 Tax=Rotaria socialis TaxID=392032 RepID=A0A817QMV3_9BILA|nr:unnamed protein product [Rotaria socialis]CAF3205269.1 unnamed protein product [Rotaria socialis]CAF3332495.1 unnamed protein product [Rotaria socialis]CAF3432232.1 unnamed protein product [Rotaria socialis]CAF4462514.1 unnamed protein product [Rotaria socialis]